MKQSTASERIKDFNAPFGDKANRKYSLMASNAYRFFRGTCHLFYEDLSTALSFPNEAPRVWGCGDLHLENFGSYKAANRYVYFDQNDFDEAMLLPATWELVRIVTGIVVAFNVLHVEEEKVLAWARLCLQRYAKVLKDGKAKHVEARLAKGIVRSFLEQAANRNTDAFYHKLIINKKSPALLHDKDKRWPIENDALKRALLEAADGWLQKNSSKRLRKYSIADACHRAAGTGSLGTGRYVLLLRQAPAKNKFLLLDMKEARPSSLQPYNPVPQPRWPSEAERVRTIQSRSQYATTALLSTIQFQGASYTIEELQPEEDKLDFTLVVKSDKHTTSVIKDMAMLTASAQLRSAGRQGSAIADELIRFAEDAAWPQALLAYAIRYAAQVNKDYMAFKKDFEAGFFTNE